MRHPPPHLLPSLLHPLQIRHLLPHRGGKNTPTQVADHPRLFVTLTAPSFGPVHLGPTKRGELRPCHPRRAGQGPDCRAWHRIDDPLIGTPLDPDTYDYAGHILFNATAGRLWSRFTIDMRRHLAEAGGLRRDQLTDHLTVSYAKVAEYQARGIIHYHAVIRIDGPHGPSTTPPTWATDSALEDAIRHAAATAVTTTPAAPGLPSRTLRFGAQTDIKTMTGTPGKRELSDASVARYIAKYATKSTEASGIELRPITCRTCHATGTTSHTLPSGTTDAVFCPDCHGTGKRGPRDALPCSALTAHTDRLLATCWNLGARPELSTLRLRQWAHTLGFRGHIFTHRHRRQAMNSTDDTQLYTITDVTQHFKISRGTVYNLIRTGQLRSITIGRTRRFTRTALTHYINTLNGGLTV